MNGNDGSPAAGPTSRSCYGGDERGSQPVAGIVSEHLQGDLFGDDAGAAAERMPTHFDTTRDQEFDLEQYRETCGRQQRLVLDWFRVHDLALATPFEIRDRVLPNAPVTSVRRAITNLTSAGLLVKTDQTKQERYGRRNYLWRLRGGLADA